MKKRIDEASIINELKGGSVFFPREEQEREPPDGKPELRAVGESETRNSEQSEMQRVESKPFKKETYQVTRAEFEELQDLKTDIRRKFDMRATNQDVLRCALQLILADYQQHKDASRIIEYLRAQERE
jgi:hypothetical protein